jgi:hypothetical protein
MEPASAFPGIQQQLRIVGAFQEEEDWKTGGRRLEDTQMASSRRFEVVRTASGDGGDACFRGADAHRGVEWLEREEGGKFRVMSSLVSLTCKSC